MGVNIKHTDEKFQKVYSEVIDYKNDFYWLSMETNFSQKKFPNIAIIDLYGNTVFNQLQIPILIEEFGILLNEAKDPNRKDYFQSAFDMLKKAKGETHTYIMFIGD